jgi:hypothetical protein
MGTVQSNTDLDRSGSARILNAAPGSLTRIQDAQLARKLPKN